MNDLMGALKVSDFFPLLKAYEASGIAIGAMIDGGAAAGASSRKMLKATNPGAICYSFEPFPGNHRFLEDLGPRVIVRKEAMAEEVKTMTFSVSSVVAADSVWGQRGMEGYSSVGYLTDTPRSGATVLEVPCVRGDAVIDRSRPVDFIKLDLQGGELNALKGMSEILDQPLFLWVEYSGQAGLTEFLEDAGYSLYDTEYFGVGVPTDEMRDHFDVDRQGVPLSTGKEAWFGFKRRAWNDFPTEFRDLKKRNMIVQTDLVCVNRRRLDAFCKMLAHVPPFLK
jgi:FkbM family methyltransferase